MKQSIFIMLGYPGSGKSTFALQLSQRIGAVRISQDGIRRETFENPREHMNADDDKMLLGIMNKLTLDVLIAGDSVIYDANVERYADRAPLYELTSRFGIHGYLIWVKTPVSVSVRRNGPDHIDKVFDRSYKQLVVDYKNRLDEPGKDEQVTTIDGDEPFELQFLHVRNACHV